MNPSELQARAIEAAKMAMTAKIKSLGLDGQSLLCALGAVDNLETALAAFEAALWCDDMDAAPRDGTPIWAYDGADCFECWFEDGAFFSSAVYDAVMVERDDIKRWRYPPAAPGEV